MDKRPVRDTRYQRVDLDAPPRLQGGVRSSVLADGKVFNVCVAHGFLLPPAHARPSDTEPDSGLQHGRGREDDGEGDAFR